MFRLGCGLLTSTDRWSRKPRGIAAENHGFPSYWAAVIDAINAREDRRVDIVE
jgi:hypothetical protein